MAPVPSSRGLSSGRPDRGVVGTAYLTHPDSPFPHLASAYLSLREGDEEGCKRSVLAAVSINGSANPFVLFRAAILLLEIRGEWQLAEELLERSVTLKPDEPLPRIALAVLIEEEGQTGSAMHLDAAEMSWGSGMSSLRDT